MDIKKSRWEADQNLEDDYPRHNYAHGSAAADQNPFWWARAQSWSEGADTHYLAIQRENEGECDRWGTPWRDTVPAPNEAWPEASSAGTASRNADDPLPNPCNYHSNPGMTSTSTASALQQAQPGSVYRTAGSQGHMPMPRGGRRAQATPGRTILPASGARQPMSEGSPLAVTQGGVPGR